MRALQHNPHVVLLNVDWYDDQLRPVLADWLYMWMEAHHMAGLSELQIKQFLLGRTSDLMRHAELTTAFQTKLSVNHKKMVIDGVQP